MVSREFSTELLASDSGGRRSLTSPCMYGLSGVCFVYYVLETLGAQRGRSASQAITRMRNALQAGFRCNGPGEFDMIDRDA